MSYVHRLWVGAIASISLATTTGCGSRDPLAAPSVERLFAPTCEAGCPGNCTTGTEVQALAAFDGAMWAGLTSWQETLDCAWPGRSAPILRQRSPDGPFEPGPGLPEDPSCPVASWEQINDLHSLQVAGREHLLAASFPNEDDCPGVTGSVFWLGDRGQSWTDTGLGDVLRDHYAGAPTEVRYVDTLIDDASDCGEQAPCVLALAGPRAIVQRDETVVGPAVFLGRTGKDCSTVCWESAPERSFDGVESPLALRVTTIVSDPDSGVVVGSSNNGLQSTFPELAQRVDELCADPNGPLCPRATAVRRLAGGQWVEVYRAAAANVPGAETEIRGAQFAEVDGEPSLFLLTHPRGDVHRLVDGEVVETVSLRDEVASQPCSTFYGYQLHLDDQVLRVASQSCQAPRSERRARLFERDLARPGDPWRSVELPEIEEIPNGPPSETAIRWIESSPFRPDELYLGTTDMNGSPGSLTARIFRLVP